MKKTKDFADLHKRVVVLDEPVWVCVDSKTASNIPIGHFSRLCEHGMIALTDEQEKKDFTDFQSVDKENKND